VRRRSNGLDHAAHLLLDDVSGLDHQAQRQALEEAPDRRQAMQLAAQGDVVDRHLHDLEDHEGRGHLDRSLRDRKQGRHGKDRDQAHERGVVETP
jgi:hypothetical protein